MNRDNNWKKQRLDGILNILILSAVVFFFLGFISSGIYFSVFNEKYVAPYYLLELLTLILVVRLILALLPSKARIANNQIQIKHLIPLIDRTVEAEEILAVKLSNKTRSVVELEEEYFHISSIPPDELEEFAQKNRIPIKYNSKR